MLFAFLLTAVGGTCVRANVRQARGRGAIAKLVTERSTGTPPAGYLAAALKGGWTKHRASCGVSC